MLIVLAGVLGGLAIFLFGLQVTGEALQKVAGRVLRGILGLATRNPVTGVVTGAFITVCTQSSSATTVFLVNFVQAGLMRFPQTIGVILGADIGTTFTVQLIAFRVADYALIMVAAGFLLKSLAHYEREKFIGQALFGFGFIFLGMLLMKQGVLPLRNSEKFIRMFLAFRQNPLLALLVATAVTAIIQSSAATIALALTLAGQGLFGTEPIEIIQASLPIIFGANIGTCATAALASIQVGSDARRVAAAHLIIKIIGVAIFFPLLRWFSHFVLAVSQLFTADDIGPARMLANSHTVFNVLITVVLLPFSDIIGRAVLLIMPSGGGREKEVYEGLLESPPLALADAREKIGQMFSTVSEMVSKAIFVLRGGDRRLLEDLKRMDDVIDCLHVKVTAFLTKLGQRTLLGEESGEEVRLLGLSHYLESLGDTVNREFLYAAQKVIDDDLSFSFAGFHEMEKLHQIVCRNLKTVEDVFKSGEKSRLRDVIESREDFRRFWEESYGSHIDRMHKGLSESSSTGAIHFHILLSLENMNSQIVNIAYLMET